MAVIRVEHNKENPYSIINKTGFDDEDLSFKAKGILAYLLSKPDDWTCQVSELQKHAADGRDSIYSGLRELKKYGYLIKRPIKNSMNIIIEWEEVLYETPQKEAIEIFEKQEKQQQKRKETFQKKKDLKSKNETNNPHAENTDKDKKPHTGLPYTDYPYPGKPYTENTDNIINNNKLNNELRSNEIINNNTTSKKNTNLSNKGLNTTYIESDGVEADNDKGVFVKILDYYKLKAHVIMEKPVDVILAKQLQEDNIPLETVKNGIDLAFETFKPKYAGDRIRSLKFCEGFIRDLTASEKAKEERLNNNSMSESEIRSITSMLKNKVSDIEIPKIIACISKVNTGDKDKPEYLKEKVNVVESYAIGKNISYTGALIKAIKENWSNTRYSAKDKFNDYGQRKYDFKDLEDKLLKAQGFYD